MPDGTALLLYHFYQLVGGKHLSLELGLESELSDLKLIFNTQEGPEDPKGENNGTKSTRERARVDIRWNCLFE